MKSRILAVAAMAVSVMFMACAKKPSPAPDHRGDITAVVTPENPNPERSAPRVLVVQFAFDSDSVSKQDAARILRDCLARPVPRVVTGYASNERSGKYTEKASKAYNLALSARRANAVAFIYTVSGCPNTQVAYLGETGRFNKNLHSWNRRVTVK